MGFIEVLQELRWLVVLHAATGELGALLFLWVVIELKNGQAAGYLRAKWVSFSGFILLFASWFFSGSYYTTHYGSVVKPVIKGGDLAWVHGVIMETKEHVFIFIPILALLTFLIIAAFPKWSSSNEIPRKPVYALSILIIGLGFGMVGLGYIISAAARATLGGGV